MMILINIPKERFADIQRIASVQVERRVPSVEQIIANGTPTIEPERKTGKWNFIGDQMFECSECGTCYTQSQFHQMRVRISDTEFPKFCPNCGAKMDGGEQDAV